MVKLKRLEIHKVDKSINKEGQVAFYCADLYVRESEITAIGMVSMCNHIDDSWSDKEITRYCKENNIKLCSIKVGFAWDFSNIIVDETIEKLIENL